MLFGWVCWYWDHRVMTAHYASLFLFNKAGSITVYMYHHITWFVSNNIIGMCCCTIKDLSDGLIYAFCRFGLLLYIGVECCENGEGYISRIVQNFSNNIMDFCFLYLSSSEVVSSSGAYFILALYWGLPHWLGLFCLQRGYYCWNLWRDLSMHTGIGMSPCFPL